MREVLAEVAAAWPRRSTREIVSDALHVADLIMQDAVPEMPADQALTPEQAEALMLAAGRASALAQQAASMGVDVDGGDVLAEAQGAAIAEAMRSVASELVNAAGGTGADQLDVREWVVAAIPHALRGEPVPACPRPWRSTHLLPALESASVVCARQAEEIDTALRGSVSAATESPVVGSGQGVNGSAVRQGSPGAAGSGANDSAVTRPESPQERDARILRSIGRRGSSLLPSTSTPYGRR